MGIRMGAMKTLYVEHCNELINCQYHNYGMMCKLDQHAGDCFINYPISIRVQAKSVNVLNTMKDYK